MLKTFKPAFESLSVHQTFSLAVCGTLKSIFEPWYLKVIRIKRREKDISQVRKYILRSISVTIYFKAMSKFAELARSGK